MEAVKVNRRNLRKSHEKVVKFTHKPTRRYKQYNIIYFRYYGGKDG